MADTDLTETEQIPDPEEITPEQRRKAKLYLIGYLLLLVIPIGTGIILANTGGSGDEDSSGMTTAPIGIVTTVPGDSARTNLSLGATVIETSSDFNETFAGANAIDGSIATEWSSRGDGDDAYIVIDLGATREITGIGFRSREMSDGTSITNTFTVTVDGGAVLGPFDAGIGMTVSDFAATGQMVRIDMDTTTGGNTGAVEIEIYGS